MPTEETTVSELVTADVDAVAKAAATGAGRGDDQARLRGPLEPPPQLGLPPGRRPRPSTDAPGWREGSPLRSAPPLRRRAAGP
jgi:hypothetical protein